MLSPLWSENSSRGGAGGGLPTHLVNNLVPLLATDSNLDGLLHETSGHDDAVKLASYTAGRFCDLRSHARAVAKLPVWRNRHGGVGGGRWYPGLQDRQSRLRGPRDVQLQVVTGPGVDFGSWVPTRPGDRTARAE